MAIRPTAIFPCKGMIAKVHPNVFMTESKSKQILILYTRDICYHSSAFFLQQLQFAFEKTGATVCFYDVSTDDYDILDELLEDKKNHKLNFDFIFDINSKLPLLQCEDGAPVLDALGIPFYHLIVDHPLYHHNVLSVLLSNYHVLCVDRRHVAYVKTYYPHIKSVSVLTIPGISSKKQSSRTHRILAPLTYQGQETLRSEWNQLSQKISSAEQKKQIEDLMEQLFDRWNPDEETLEDTLLLYLEEKKKMPEDYGVLGFRELLNHCYLVDKRKRNALRRKFVTDLADAGLPIDLLGEGWEDTDIAEKENVRLLLAVPIAKLYDLASSYDVLLDVNPLFFDGMHDRVSAALSNGTLVLSNMTPRFCDFLKEETGVFFYQTSEELIFMAKRALALADSPRANEIRKRERAVAEEFFSWEMAANKILSLTEESI